MRNAQVLRFLIPVLAVVWSGCTGGPCNPPPILYPVLIPLAIPIAITARIREHNRRADLKPIAGGDAVERPFRLHGSMSAAELRQQEYFGYWAQHKMRSPGISVRWSSARVNGRTIDAVVYRDVSTSAESCYYFDVTDVTLSEAPPSPTPLAGPGH